MAKSKTAVKTAENGLKTENKELKPGKSILRGVPDFESACIRLNNELILRIIVDGDGIHGEMIDDAGKYVASWTAVFDE